MGAILQKIKGLWERLKREQACPAEIARGFAAGLYVSFLPIPPFQTVAAMALAWLCRGNQVAGLLGLHLHLLLLPLVPLVFLEEYTVGCRLLQVHPAHTHPVHFSIHDMLQWGWEHLEPMFAGSLVIGLPAALISYWIVKSAAARWQAGGRNLRSEI